MDDAQPIAEEAAPAVAPWARAVAADLAGVDLEAPIAGLDAADCQGFAEAFFAAVKVSDGDSPLGASAASRVWAALGAIASFHFKPADPHEPYGPMMVLGETRTAIPADFASRVDLVAGLAESTSNLPLKARLCDVAWLLDRKRAALGSRAIGLYLDIIGKVEAGELKYSFSEPGHTLLHETHDLLLRALGIARTLGWDKPAALAARGVLVDLRKRAVAAAPVAPVLWFSRLDLQVGASNPADIAGDLDSVLAREVGEANVRLERVEVSLNRGIPKSGGV
jgi:hypothetical protein